MAIAALMGVGTAVKGEEVPSLDLNFDGQTSSYTRATTAADAAKANGDQLATSIVTQGKTGTVQSKYMGPNGKLINGYVTNLYPGTVPTNNKITFTTNQGTAPDGTNTAIKATEDSALGEKNANTATISVTSGTQYTMSLFAKPAGRTGIRLLMPSSSFGSDLVATYDLQGSGSIIEWGGSNAPDATTITPVGNGWYRISITGTATNTGNSILQLVIDNDGTNTNTSYQGDGSSGLLIWGIQMEEGAAPSELVQTTSGSVSDQVARIEYDASGNPLGLLVEEQRTNLLTQSSDLTHSDWTASNVGVTANQVDPAGGTGAFLIEDSSTNYGLVRQQVTGVAGSTYTASLFVKQTASAASELLIRFKGLTEANRDCNLDTSTGDISGSPDIAVQDYNGWWRISVTTTLVSATTLEFTVYPAHASSFNGTPDATATTTAGTHIVYGPQIEVGEAATSYIPTSGASALRPADDITVSTSSFGFDVADGSTAIDATAASEPNSSFPRLFEYRGSSTAYRIFGRVSSGNLQVGFADSATGTSLTSTLATGVTYPLVATVGAAHTGTNISYALDGDGAGSATSSGMSTALTTLKLGGQVGQTTNTMNGHIRRLRYWPRAINDAQLSKFTNQ